MAEPDSEISEPIQESEHIEPPAEPTAPEHIATEPEPVKRGKGRPAGSKDKIKRTVKPKVLVKLIPEPAQPVEPVEPAQPPQPAQPEPPEPPSPRTLYRETSRHLVHLRGLINNGRTSEVASRYTQKLTQWPVI